MRRDARGGGTSMMALWRLPGFGRLSIAFALNELAWFFGTLSLSLLVYRRTGSALGTSGFFLCSQGLPALVAPVLVARLDRASPRRLLPLLYWSEAVMFGLLAYLAHRFLLIPVLAVVVVDGVLALTARSVASAARTEILRPADLLKEGGALQGMMFSTAFLLGPLIAGVVTATGGTVAALIVDCGLFAAMGVSLVSSTVPGSIVHEGPEHGRLRAALAYARANRAVRTVLSLQTVAYILYSIPTPLEVVFCVHVLHVGSAGYGAMLAAWGGGALIGSIVYGRARNRSVRVLIGGSSLLIGIGFAVIAGAPDLVVTLVGAVLGGIANGIGVAAFYTELTEVVPQSWTALVMSLFQSIGVLAPGLGVAVGGILATIFDVRITFAVGAGGCVALAALVGWLLTPTRMVRPEPEADGDGVGDGATAVVTALAAEESAVHREPDTSTLA